MRLGDFFRKCNFFDLSEVEKIKHLYFYQFAKEKKSDFTVKEISNLLSQEGFSTPNTSRLKDKLKKSRDFIKGVRTDSFTLQKKNKEDFKNEFPELNEDFEEIITIDTILPNSLYINTRGYIEKLAKQINSSYENNVFDGCAVLMRRLLEVLLILGYEHINKKTEIEENGELKNLNFIINYTLSNNPFSLSKGTRECLDDFRKLGNFSAHRIQYNCRKTEIKNVAMEFRVCIEELLYANGLKK